MRRKLQGSFAIESAYLIPLILMVLAVVFHVLFYYHDKNVLLGTAHEVASYGAALESTDEDSLEQYFLSRVSGRLLLFTNMEQEIEVQEEKVSVKCTAKKRGMSLAVACDVNRTDPEDYIRSVRKIIKIGEGIGKKN